MRFALVVLLFLVSVCPAQKVDVLFLGVVGGGAPSFEGTFESLLRERLSVDDTMRIADAKSVTEYGLLEGLSGSMTLTDAMVHTISEHYPENILVVWASIRSQSIRPVRRYLVTRYDRGDASVELFIYSMRDARYLFSGEMACSVSRYSGVLLFYPIGQEHMTAPQRALLSDELSMLAASRSLQALRAVVSSRFARQELDEQAVAASKSSATIRAVDSAGARMLNRSTTATVPDSLSIPPTDSSASDTTSALPETSGAESAPATP